MRCKHCGHSLVEQANLTDVEERVLEDDIIPMMEAEAEMVTNNGPEDPVA